MDLEISFLNNVSGNVDSAIEKVVKFLTELQALRRENTTLKTELTNAKLNKQNLAFEVDKLRQTSKDLKGQIATAYSVINAFNKQQADRTSIFSHQSIQAEAMKAENTFLTEQISIFQENISKLTIENLELLAKCQQLEINARIFDEKYTNAWELLHSLDKAIRKLDENQKSFKSVIETSKIDVKRVNESIQSYKIKNNQLKQDNLKLSEKITELLLRLPITNTEDPCVSLVEECDKLTSALAYEKSKNIELSTSLAKCVSHQNKLFKTFGTSYDKSVQTECI